MAFETLFNDLAVCLTVVFILSATSDFIAKIEQHDNEIKKLILRLEECEKNNESSQDS